MYVAKFRQYIVPHSVAYVCIQSVCDVTELEKWGGYAPPTSEVGGAVAPLASLSRTPLQLFVCA